MRNWKALVSVIVFATVGAAASAEIPGQLISEYNAARLSGDGPQIVQTAGPLARAAMANPEHPEAALIAFEAAWALCRNGACNEAAPAARFAAARSDAPAGARVLDAFVGWKLTPDRDSRRALDAALETAAANDPTTVSVVAFREAYLHDKAKGKHADAARLARLAASHFARAGEAARQFEVEARTLAIAAEFCSAKDTDRLRLMREMLHLSGELQRDVRRAEEPAQWLTDLRWASDAWVLAMGAYFESAGGVGVTSGEQATILAGYLKDLPEEVADDPRAFCKGELQQRPALTYPAGASERGMFGSVLIGFSVVDGVATDLKVLASVPFDGFRQKALETVSKWTWKVKDSPEATGCRLSYENIVLPMVFVLQ